MMTHDKDSLVVLTNMLFCWGITLEGSYYMYLHIFTHPQIRNQPHRSVVS